MNTGAIASWMTWAMLFNAGGMREFYLRRLGGWGPAAAMLLRCTVLTIQFNVGTVIT
jgi:hypothetical protein